MSTSEQNLIFGTGPVGKSIMTELVKQGKTVTMVNRSGKIDNAPVGVTVVKGDVTDLSFTQQIAQGKSHIYHSAQPAYTEWTEKFPAINNSILSAAKSAKAKLIVMDNLYMYGPLNGKLITEDLPYRATGKKGIARIQMAQTFLEAHKKGDVKVVIGRASDFFGAGVIDSSAGEIMFGNAVAGKTVQVLGSADVPHTYSYMADIGKALVILAQHDEAYGKAWHLPNAETLTTRQFIDLIAKEVGQPLKIMAAGKFMVSALGLFMPMMREFKETLYQFAEPFEVDDTPFKKAFGNPTTPLKDAIKATVAWFKQHAPATK